MEESSSVGAVQQRSLEISFSDIKKDIFDILEKESQAISFAAQNLPDSVINFVQVIIKTSGRLVFSGMGKSGIVARKLAATYSSVGIPSFFLHPGDALHGDLGMVRSEDFFIALSKSATGTELEQIFATLRVRGNVIGLVCCGDGNLIDFADVVVRLPFQSEACFLNLVPTSSSTLMIAFGDAVALAVSKQRGFCLQDFAKFHPRGALGKRLLLTVNSLMNNLSLIPKLHPELIFKDVLIEISRYKLGVGIVFDNQEEIKGIITDGDLRRACELGPSVFEKTAEQIMTKNPKTINDYVLAYDALIFMEKFNITTLIVQKNAKPIGVINIHDLIKAGIR